MSPLAIVIRLCLLLCAVIPHGLGACHRISWFPRGRRRSRAGVASHERVLDRSWLRTVMGATGCEAGGGDV